MLQQEQITETMPEPLVLGNALPPTTEELAQAIIAREDRERAYAVISTDADRMARTVQPLGIDISPEELMAEVRAQRRQANQEKVMSKRKNALNGTALAFLGGMVGACAVALFLVYTNYLMYRKLTEVYNDQLQNQQQARLTNYNAVSSASLLEKWKYPGARQMSYVGDAAMSSDVMTTADSFAKIWHYYTQQMGYQSAFDNPQLPYTVNKNENMPLTNKDWGVTEGQQTVNYRMRSSNLGGNPFMLFTRQAGVNTVTVMVTPGAAKNIREITIYTTDSR